MIHVLVINDIARNARFFLYNLFRPLHTNGLYEWQTVFQSTMQIMQATVCSENTKGKQFLWESPETLLNCKHLFGA